MDTHSDRSALDSASSPKLHTGGKEPRATAIMASPISLFIHRLFFLFTEYPHLSSIEFNLACSPPPFLLVPTLRGEEKRIRERVENHIIHGVCSLFLRLLNKIHKHWRLYGDFCFFVTLLC